MLLLLLATGCSSRGPGEVRVLAAASLVDLFHALGPSFHEAGIDVRPAFGASAQIRTQVEHGAPVDLFVSADAEDVRLLQARALIEPDGARVLYHNHLVVIAPVGSSVARLEDARRIGMGEPSTVPAGRYAKQSLERLGLFERLRPRLVLGADVRIVLGWVARGEVDAGIVYDTDRRAEEARVRVVRVLPDASHDPIEYVAAIPRGAAHPARARDLLTVLASPAGRREAESEGFEAVMTALPGAPR
jgi:molybdate transport system substrate-binding protein